MRMLKKGCERAFKLVKKTKQKGTEHLMFVVILQYEDSISCMC